MPFIVTTKRPVRRWIHTQGGKQDVESFLLSRRAVATLEEAKHDADVIVARALSPKRPGRAEAMLAIIHMPESGGTVGPLPDGTVIEVERVVWDALVAEHADHESGGFVSQVEILAAFNAREANR